MRKMRLALVMAMGVMVMAHAETRKVDFSQDATDQPPKGFEFGHTAGVGKPGNAADPLPQALALTAIVITFGVTALLFALAFRSWLLTRDDEVQDDVADRTVGGTDVVHDEVADQLSVIEREEAP